MFKRFVFGGLAFYLALACTQNPIDPDGGQTNSDTPVVTLEVIRVWDPRLPVLSEEDLGQLLSEAEKIISTKLGDQIDIQFHDRGIAFGDKFFADDSYRHGGTYNRFKDWKYDLGQGPKMPFLQTEKFKNQVTDFLQSNWELKSLQEFFPDERLTTYQDAFTTLMKAYHQKIAWLKTLKTAKGEGLLAEPLPAFQSYVEWIAIMYEQDQVDIVFTNALIAYDLLSKLYPHTVSKHAKVGGSSFTSPKRKPLDGKSLMVNIIEEYGGIEGLSGSQAALPKETKNKILGGYYFAHEFGHAFFLLPDMYDHGDSCLMNNSLNTDPLSGYQALVNVPSPCPKCRPWILAKENIVQAELAYVAKQYSRAGELYLKGLELTPKRIDGSYKNYSTRILKKAMEAFGKDKNEAGLKKCEEMAVELMKI